MFKDYKPKYLMNDIFAGVIIALVSIPMGLGYAQVSGLPVVYGLYGSLLPILFYGLLASSPQFIFGVDAAPAALVGGTIASMGVMTGSAEAVRYIPVITFITACWLLLFYVVRAGKLVTYISTPVMGGFITGIGITIILMQVPKLYGGKAGTGELIELTWTICKQLPGLNVLSLVLGLGTVIIIIVAKKIMPKFPMSVVMMGLGMLLTAVFHVDRFGVKLLPSVEPGLPSLIIPDFTVLQDHLSEFVLLGLTTALVILSSTLLSACNFAIKNNYKINNNREVLAYSAANFASAIVGCCPVNGSVSRTGMGAQLGGKSQMMSVFASLFMALVLLVGTPFISFMPVPVLTGIVIAALYGILEITLAKKLWKTDKSEFLIFMMACFGVLLFGTIYGVVIGIVLSFIAVIIKAVIPPKEFLGVIPGQEGFYGLNRNRNARAIQNTVLYRFSGTLFFGNINAFVEDIENAVSPDVKTIIVDASGIACVDITAADRLLVLNRNLNEKGIHFYITEHVGAVNDQLRTLGVGSLVEEGVVRRTISLALRDAGINKPYPLLARDGVKVESDQEQHVVEANEYLAEFEWAFGKDADAKMEQLATEMVEELGKKQEYNVEALKEAENHVSWGRIGLFDEDELLDRLEMHLSEYVSFHHLDHKRLEEKIEERRAIIEEKLTNLNPDSLRLLKKHRQEVEEHIREINPKAYEHTIERRRIHLENLENTNPRLAKKIKELYNIDLQDNMKYDEIELKDQLEYEDKNEHNQCGKDQ